MWEPGEEVSVLNLLAKSTCLLYRYHCYNHFYSKLSLCHRHQGKAGEDEAAVAENNFTVKCAKPKNLKVDEIGLDEATISWEVDSTTGIVSSDFYLYLNDTVLVTGPFDFENGVYSRYISYEDELLFAGNTYKVSVKTSCSTEAQSEVVSTSFATKCDVYDLKDLKITEPTENKFLPCWTIDGGHYFGTYDGIFLNIYNGTKLITPAINFEANNLEIYIDLKFS